MYNYFNNKIVTYQVSKAIELIRKHCTTKEKKGQLVCLKLASVFLSHTDNHSTLVVYC